MKLSKQHQYRILAGLMCFDVFTAALAVYLIVLMAEYLAPFSISYWIDPNIILGIVVGAGIAALVLAPSDAFTDRKTDRRILQLVSLLIFLLISIKLSDNGLFASVLFAFFVVFLGRNVHHFLISS